MHRGQDIKILGDMKETMSSGTLRFFLHVLSKILTDIRDIKFVVEK